MGAVPPGYRFLRIVLIVGAIGFAVIGVLYLTSGQLVPGVFALVLAVAEAAALPIFKRLMESSRSSLGNDTMPPDKGAV